MKRIVSGLIRSLIRTYKNLNIKRKLLLVLYIQIIIPILFIGYISYYKSSQIIENKSDAYSRDILRLIEFRTNDYIQNVVILSQDILYNEKIYDALKYENFTMDPLKAYENQEGISSILKQFILLRKEIDSICLISNEKKYYIANNNLNNVMIMESIPYDDIYKKASKQKGKVIWVYTTKGEKIDNVFLARMVYDPNSFKEIGLLVVLINKEALGKVYQDLTREVVQNIAIVTSENKEIVSRDSNNTFLNEESFLGKLHNKTDSFIGPKKEMLVSYVTLDNPSWKVISYVSVRQMYEEINMLKYIFIILSIVSILILSVLSIFIAIDFINPINTLIAAMKKVEQGDNSINVSVDRNDELGFLSQAFNKMANEIDHLVKWIYKEQITRKEAEIKALQAQINPHFLFNTLESINWMARLNNVPQISDTVSVLSSLMETSIGRDDKLITVDEEFKYIDNFYHILKMRFEDRLELRKIVNNQALQAKIPRLLIQPLVENAVYHGIENSDKHGIILLKAVISDDTLMIEITDNGIGIGEEDMELLNKRLSINDDTYFRSLTGKRTRSIGIENVNRRIKLFYGEKYGLKIESRIGMFTKVTVAIPARLEDADMKEEGHV